MSSFILSERIIDRILKAVFPKQLDRRIAIKSVALEGIIGHMTYHAITSLEAGIILVADGCDMERGAHGSNAYKPRVSCWGYT